MYINPIVSKLPRIVTALQTAVMIPVIAATPPTVEMIAMFAGLSKNDSGSSVGSIANGNIVVFGTWDMVCGVDVRKGNIVVFGTWDMVGGVDVGNVVVVMVVVGVVVSTVVVLRTIFMFQNNSKYQ